LQDDSVTRLRFQVLLRILEEYNSERLLKIGQHCFAKVINDCAVAQFFDPLCAMIITVLCL